MKTTFDEIIEIVLDHEGGYVNDQMMLVVKPSMESLKDGILMWILKILPKNKLKKYIIQTIGDEVSVMKFLHN